MKTSMCSFALDTYSRGDSATYCEMPSIGTNSFELLMPSFTPSLSSTVSILGWNKSNGVSDGCCNKVEVCTGSI